MKLYDCFCMFNELDIVELRLNELYDVVDHFIIHESTRTHTGKPKPLYFAENKELALGTWEGQKSPLAEKSLAVIFRFIEWDSERIDLIKDITDFTEEEIEKHETFKFRGLAEHIKEFKDYKKEKGIIN